MTLVGNGQPESISRALQSQHELSAFASMVVASLPFPPLPVLVLQGEDGEYGVASSFDLLQQAIVVQLRLVIDSKNLFIGQYDKLFEEYWLSPISYLSPYRG
jgi:hypothetical protein